MVDRSEQPQIIVHSTGPVSRWLSWLGWLGLLLCLPVIFGMLARYHDYFDQTGGISEKYVSHSKTARNKVAIIRAVGLLAESDGFVKKQIERVKADENVKAIVLRVDSPGGTVTASDYLYHHLCLLRDEKKVPVVVSMGAIAAERRLLYCDGVRRSAGCHLCRADHLYRIDWSHYTPL